MNIHTVAQKDLAQLRMSKTTFTDSHMRVNHKSGIAQTVNQQRVAYHFPDVNVLVTSKSNTDLVFAETQDNERLVELLKEKNVRFSTKRYND